MKLIKIIQALFLAYFLSSCAGGGSGSDELITNEAKFKQNAFYQLKIDGVTEFLTDLYGNMVEKNGASWSYAVGSTSTVTSTNTTGELNIVLPLLHSAHTSTSPLNNQVLDIAYSGVNGEEITESIITPILISDTFYNIQLVLDPLYDMAIISDNFISTYWQSIYNAAEVNLTIDSNKMFVLNSSLGTLITGNCVIQGEFPDSINNYIVVKAEYTCTPLLGDVMNGFVYPTFRTNEDNSQLTVLVSATSTELNSFSAILQKQ